MTDRETIDVYQAQAQRYADIPISDMQRAAIDRFLSMLPARAAILDAGCGPGVHAAVMVSAGHDVHGIDPTEAFVTDALSRGVNARLGSFDDISGNAIFDGVYASFSLLHAPRAKLPRHLAAVSRALKSGGVFHIGMKTGQGDLRDDIDRFYTLVTVLELAELVTDAGFNVIATREGEGKGCAGTIDPFVIMRARKDG